MIRMPVVSFVKKLEKKIPAFTNASVLSVTLSPIAPKSVTRFIVLTGGCALAFIANNKRNKIRSNEIADLSFNFLVMCVVFMEVGNLMINVYEYGSFSFWAAVCFAQKANVQVDRAGVPLGGYIYVLILLL